MINNITPKHEKIFDFLVKLHDKNNEFIFVPRKINNKNRMNKGYWFIGDSRYLQVSLWRGTDWKEKIHNISFVVKANGESYLEISAQDSADSARFLRLLVDKLGGFSRTGNKNKWYREYSDNEYMANLQSFLKNEKSVIDEMIRKHNPKGIAFPDGKFYEKYVGRIIDFRNKQKVFGDTHKVVRICWNTEGWKFPSGLEGKSLSNDSFECQNGYGHEEWLFDRSRIIEGYHYAFLQPLNVESGKHVDKTYDISLFTINGDGRKFYVGDIKNVKCISKDEAKKAYQAYKDNGWIDEMVAEIKEADANPQVFLDNLPKFIFNVKFKLEDIHELDEIEEISGEDTNITTTRFKLLPKIANLETKNISVEEDEDDDKFKDESDVTVIYNKEIRRTKYHNKMQNVVKSILKQSYRKVSLEKNHVDVTAETYDGKLHFFEVKTRTPKICIREAFGQVMEYVYWPDVEEAEKMIIVGDTFPDEEAQRYLKYIRRKFKLPIFYRCINVSEKVLSDEF